MDIINCVVVYVEMKCLFSFYHDEFLLVSTYVYECHRLRLAHSHG